MMITNREEIINNWQITPQDLTIFYQEVGESLTDIGGLYGFTFVEILETGKLGELGYGSNVEGSENLVKLAHLFNPKLDTLIPPDEVLLISCIAKNYYLDIIKKASDLTKNFYLKPRQEALQRIFQDDNFEGDKDLQYVSSYDMIHFLENETIWDDDTSDKFIEMLCYAINKCKQIKVNWYLVLSYYR